MTSTFSASQSSGYISFPITLNPNIMIQNAFAAIQAQFPGWTPREGQLDVAIIEENAQIAATAAMVASQVPGAIFEYFGPLVGINPILGVQATVPVTFTMVDVQGYTIPAGTVVAYPLSGNQQILFTVPSPVVIPAGTSTGTTTLICETVGTFANDLAAATCQMVTTFAQVVSVATTAVSANGVDAETSTAYLNRLANELQLLAPRPILASDYAAMAPNVAGVYRALAIDGLNPGRTVTDAGTTSASDIITSASANFSAAVDVGRTITGAGVPTGTTISSVTNSTTIVASANATVSATGVTLSFGDLTGQERYVTVCGLDVSGVGLTPTVTAALQSYLAGKREVNFVVATIEPTVTSIDVSVTVEALPTAVIATVQSAVQSSLAAFLNPANWGGGNLQVPSWSNTANVVRFLDVANVIHTTQGVVYIPSGALTINIHGQAAGSVDITLPGDAPLPTLGSVAITVTT